MHRNGVENIGLIFSKPEKRTNWEEVFTEAKNRLGEENHNMHNVSIIIFLLCTEHNTS